MLVLKMLSSKPLHQLDTPVSFIRHCSPSHFRNHHLYSDGGPDHRLTYVSVQLSLICLFIKLDLDYLCAGRTAPYHSWRNPVERIMSVLNLGLQCIGLARDQMPDEFEKEVEKCNNLTELRNIASRKSGILSAVQDSLSPVKILLTTVFSRLKLHENYIKSYASASSAELDEFGLLLFQLMPLYKKKGIIVRRI